MKDKQTKNSILLVVSINIVFLIVLNIFAFVVPFNKNNLLIHYLSYGFCELVIILECLLMLLTISSGKEKRVFGLPLIYNCWIAIGIQSILTIITFILNAFINIYLWLFITIEVIFICLFILQALIGLYFKGRSNDYTNNKRKNEFMDTLRWRLKSLQSINKNSNIENSLQELVEKAIGSDPISNEGTFEIEEEILSNLNELDINIKESKEDETISLINKLSDLLNERNILCKSSK